MPIKHLKAVRAERLFSRARGKRARSLLSSALLAIGALGLVGFFFLTLTLAWLSQGLPDPNALLDREVPQSTRIYDRTGETLLYEIHGDEKRTLVTIEEIPDSVKWATIAIEDKDFYKHHGIYWKGLVRAFTIGYLRNQRVQGTSTLTQQLVKNAILSNERTPTRKLKEILLSLQIERKYSKDQILQLYLNEIPYGSTLYGIESAAQGYFTKPAKELTLDESALLAALPQSPDTYNPYGAGSRGDNRELLIARQHTILNAMADQGYITKEQADAAKEIKTLEKLAPKSLGDIHAPHFVMWVRAQLAETYGQKMVETGGLKVITTLDWEKQQAGEKAVSDGVAARGEQYDFTNAALAAVDPKTGQVLTMVGSTDFFNEEIDGQVNVTVRPRQPGSSFKPMIYAAGFMLGYLPETQLWDVDTVFKTGSRDYTPRNYDLGERGPISIRSALQLSLNTPAVKMLYLVGVGRALDLAEQLGYSTFADRDRFGLSLVLGGGEVKLLEHVSAYGTFATEGIHMPTSGILRVEDASGKMLEEWKQPEGARVFEPQIARLISNVLSDDASRAPVFGAGSALTLPGRPVAAKTGTTNDYHDAWTMGYTPSLAAGVWAGNNNNDPMTRAGGSLAAAPIWNAFMREALKGTPVESFTRPAPATTDKPALLGTAFEKKVKVDTITGKLATDLTPTEFVEEKTVYEAHSILHYIDRSNPRGDAPANPAQDPQYTNWETAVKRWAEAHGWNATSTVPTETDDLHVTENIPAVSIQSPQQNESLTSRQVTLHVRISAPRRITSLTVLMEGYVLAAQYGRSLGENGEEVSITANIPNAISKGFHDLSVEARDDVGNAGRATIQINLLADAGQSGLSISNPTPGSTIERAGGFPRDVTISVADLSDIVKVDLYMDLQNGASQLVGSSVQPDTSPITFQWTSVAIPGPVILYAVATDDDADTETSDRVSVFVR
ncbi:MAG: hypothetical protein RL141_587 [Candidatus Parcubacteria bacterium]|jgi:penicillin-binding protein 1C